MGEDAENGMAALCSAASHVTIGKTAKTFAVNAKSDVSKCRVYTIVSRTLALPERRDPKGLYKKARAGEIKNFTGISDPYEAPVNPELTVDTGNQTLEESAQVVINYLEEKGYIEKA